MNHVILTGRLTKDPEIRYTDSKKAVCSFTLAVEDGRDSDGKKKAQFIPCVAWGKTAELIDQYFTKGKPLTVTGRITVRTYEKNGEKRYITEVVASGIEFPLTVREEATTATAFEDLSEDIDLPF
jgi:single-strand DNA-binding protein